MKQNQALRVIAAVTLLALLCSPLPAMESAWRYSVPGSGIGGVAVSASGSSIVVGAGKIWFFSGSGDLLGKVPFANQVEITPDGSALVASYFSRVYLFRKNPRTSSEPEKPYVLSWEKELPANVRSMDISNDGKTITVSTEGKGLYIFSIDGNTTGYNDKYFPIARVSADGRVIAAISQEGITTFARNGRVLKNPESSLVMQPEFMQISSRGNVTVFNEGQKVRGAYTGNGTGIWENRASGTVTALAMTPSGSAVIVGTENGFIDYFDGNGKVLWRNSTTGEGQAPSGVHCVAVSDSGDIITGGTQKGKIVYLKKTGDLVWVNETRDRLQNIAMSADGSLVVATGDNMLYGFSMNPSPSITPAGKKVLRQAIAVNHSTPRYTVPSGEETITPEITIPSPTPVPREYSVVHTSTRTPLPYGMCILAFCAAVVLHKKAQGINEKR